MIKVKTLSQTCGACPSQWEGKTTNDEEIYIRYRWGTLRVDINKETVYCKVVGGEYDGTMDFWQLTHHTQDILDFDGCMLKNMN